MTQGTTYLMYHQIQATGGEPIGIGQGFLPYVVTEPDFKAQLALLKKYRLKGISVGEALAERREGAGIALTFDDGCESDLTVAAPLLKETGFTATFYVVVDYIGRRGFLSTLQLRHLASAGFEIGCHSMTHAYLNGLSPRELQIEIVEAKRRLEQMMGRSVDHFSCPGGRWSTNAAAIARAAGYRSMVTSHVRINRASTDRFRLGRLAVKRGVSAVAFCQLCRGKGLFRLRAQEIGLSLARTALGNVMYDKLRATVFGWS